MLSYGTIDVVKVTVQSLNFACYWHRDLQLWRLHLLSQQERLDSSRVSQQSLGEERKEASQSFLLHCSRWSQPSGFAFGHQCFISILSVCQNPEERLRCQHLCLEVQKLQSPHFFTFSSTFLKIDFQSTLYCVVLETRKSKVNEDNGMLMSTQLVSGFRDFLL